MAAWPLARVIDRNRHGEEAEPTWPSMDCFSAKALRNDDKHMRLPNTSAITLTNTDGEALRILIDGLGICVGFGSACSALAPEPSPGLISLGLTPKEARATMRFSLCPGTSQEDLQEAVKRLTSLY
ncbi:MAG: hypothetical protein WCK42_03950 [Myxococcaceae bacterium]